MSDDRVTPEGEPIAPANGDEMAATATEQAGAPSPAETEIAPEQQPDDQPALTQ